MADTTDEHFEFNSSPLYHIKIIVNKSRSYESDLMKDFMNFQPTVLRTSTCGEALKFALGKDDVVDIQLMAIGGNKSDTSDDTTLIEMNDLSVTAFLDLNNCGRAEEGSVFLNSSTKWDCWNEKEMTFGGLCMETKRYPTTSSTTSSSTTATSPSKSTTNDAPPLLDD
jgi:hypothetical protein